MPRSLVTPPAVEPLSLAEAKLHLRVDGTDEDDLISSLIVAAREYAENYTGRAFITQTWDLYLDSFGDFIQVPLPRLQSVTSVTYTDLDSAPQTVSSSVYTLDTASEPGRINRAFLQSWPADVAPIPNAIKVRFIAGYGDDAASVPAGVKSAMRLMIGHLYANRESVVVGTVAAKVPNAVEHLLAPFRVRGPQC